MSLKSKKRFVDRRTDGRTFETGFIRSTLSKSRPNERRKFTLYMQQRRQFMLHCGLCHMHWQGNCRIQTSPPVQPHGQLDETTLCLILPQWHHYVKTGSTWLSSERIQNRKTSFDSRYCNLWSYSEMRSTQAQVIVAIVCCVYKPIARYCFFFACTSFLFVCLFICSFMYIATLFGKQRCLYVMLHYHQRKDP